MPRHRFEPRLPAWSAGIVLFSSIAAITLSPTPASPQEPKNVYLVLKADPTETEETIRKMLKKAIKLAAATIDEPLTVKAVSPGFFEEFQALVDKAGGAPLVDPKNGPIRLIPSRDVIYEIKLSPSQLLTELRVTYSKGGLKKYNAKGEGTALRLTAPGRYAFTPEAGDTPLKYEVDVAELRKPNVTLDGVWPQEDRYFVATLRNFRGSQKDLFDVFKKPGNFPNRIDVEKLQNDMVFAFASLKAQVALRKGKVRISQNELILTMDTLRNTDPKRVWVYFPLRKEKDKDEVAAKLAEYRKYSAEQLVTEIRKTSVKLNEAGSIGPDDPPRWFELPPRLDSGPPDGPYEEYQRTIRLADIPKLAEKYPSAWFLVVWEFDDGTTQEAIRTADEKGNPVYVLEQELPDWSKEIKNAGARKP